MDEESENMTALFRRQACFLLSSVEEPQTKKNDNDSSAMTLRDIQSSLGHRCLVEENDYINRNNQILTMEAREASTFVEKLDMNAPASSLHCHGCGCWMQPGKNVTIRLRSVGRGRTRRRRASRRKAAKLVSKQQASVGGGRQFSQSIEERNATELAELYNVTDGTIRNCIVYTCHSCGTKRKAKGLPVLPDHGRKQPKQHTTNGRANNTKSINQNIKSSNKRKKVTIEMKRRTSTAAALEENLDFVPLAQTTKNMEEKIPAKPSTGRRLIKEPSKKKSKKEAQQQPGKSSKLLNFLSSLND